MGDEIKLSCSETSSHNYACELKDVFLRRFKLSDEFWKDLFFDNCPEGLGEVNEKLRNGEDLSSCDFKPFEDLPFHQENHSCNTENDILNKSSGSVVEFKTPLLIKSLSNASHSPSLFSPSVTQDYNVQKGPNSSTPLPWKSVYSPSTPSAGTSTTTPTSTKNIFHNDFKTPVVNILDQTFTNPKTTTSKLSRSLSATLEMDPAGYLSWTSSLATPPEHEEKTSTNISDLQGTTLFDVSKIVAEERVPCEIEGKSKSSKGVARVLFTNECQGFERGPLAKEFSLESNTALETSSMLNLPVSVNMSLKNETFNASTALESDTSKHLITGECDDGLCDSVDATCRLKPGNHVGNDTRDNISEIADKDYLGTVTENIESFSNECKGSQNGVGNEANRNTNYTVDYFDTSMLSPLHRSVEQAMVRMTAMVDTPKLFLPGENNIPNPNNNKKQDRIDFSNRPIVIDAALNLALEKCDKTGNINNVDDINICSESTVNMEASKECVDIKHEDCKNVFDMDALSEFPLDFEFSEGIAVSTTGTQPINSNLDQPTIVCKQEDQYSKNHLFLVNLSKQVDGANTKCCIEDLDIVRVTKQPSRTMTSSERISDNSSDPGEIVTKKDYLDSKNINTRQISNMLKTDTLPKSYNGKKHDSELVSIGRNEESKTRKLRRNVETASQVLRDLSLQHLCDITYDAEDIPDLQLTAETKLNEQSEMMSSDNLTSVDIENGRCTNDLKVDETCADASVVGEQKIDSFFFDTSNEGEKVFKDIKNDKSVLEQNGSSVLSTASGRNITVSKESLKKAITVVTHVGKDDVDKCEESKRVNENDSIGFLTVSGSEEEVTADCEKTLEKARISLNEVDKDEGNTCKSNIGMDENATLGFSTASGKKITFSEESLNRARKILNDVDEEENIFNSERAVKKNNLGATMASAKKLTFPETSLVKDMVKDKEEYQDGQQPHVSVSVGFSTAFVNNKPAMRFSTASGKEVTVSDKSLKRARQILNEVDKDEEYSCQDNRRVKGKGNVGFSTASGKEVVVSNESLEKARKILDDVVKDEEKFQETRKLDMKTNVGFSTASGKKVSISEESLQKARRILNDVDNNKEYSCQDSKRLDVKTKFGFSTASGKEVTVSEESLQKARRILNEVDKEEQNETVSSRNVKEKPGVGFSTAFKRVTFSEEALEKGRKILNDMVKDEEKYQGSSNMKGKSDFRFSTASGKHVTISEKSLEQARKILNEVDKDGQNKCENSTRMNEKPDVGLPITSGKKMSISDESLENGPSLDGKKCRDNKQLGLIGNVGFSTASGKEVIVSEESLQKARRILNEVDKDEQNETVSSRRVNEKPGNGFSTASGKEVIVSEESLQKARRILNELDKDDQNEIVSSRRVNEKVGNGFSTASGKEVIVSEESLQKARRILNEVNKDEQNETVSSRRVNEKLGNGFSTASGKEVTVSDESLEKAKKILNEVVKDKEYSCQGNRNVKGKANVGFSTASGKEVAISEESLQKATRILNEIDKDEQIKCENERRVVVNESHVGFSTASGRQVAVSKESLKKARRILSEVDKDEENKYDGGKRTDEKPYVSTAFKDNVTVSDESLENPERIMNELDEDEKGKCKENRKVQVFEYALAYEKKATTSGDLLQRESGFGPRRKSKRPSVESEDVRPCKALRTETNVSNAVNQAVLCSKQEESRSWMKPYSSDPLEFYSDRKYSKFKSPLKPVVVSPDCEFTKQVSSRKQSMDTSGKWFSHHRPKSEADINDDQRRCKEYSSSTVNAMTKRKSNSYFVTPYRTSECDGNSVKRQLSAQTFEPQSVSNNTSRKKSKLNDYCDPGNTRSGKTSEDKKFLVKPQAGSIYRLRNNSSFKRISFADYVGNGNKSWSSNELFKYGIPPSVLSINCENAGSYRFNGSDFLSDNARETNTGVRFTDGAVLFLGQDKCFGVEEFTKAFLSSPGVDCNLISEQWISNHYRWIIWKLASYEVTYPQLFCGRSLTPDMVLRQLKYRYDREIDRCERSAIKKILERDDTASRGMVLCISNMDIPNPEINETKTNGQETSFEAKQKIVLMTDGWYCIRVQLDSYLQILAKQGKIFTGQKLYIQGAELVGSDQAVSPLEAPCNLFLRIYGNSCRPAKKLSRLGFHCKNSTFTVPIKSLSSNGGLVSSISVIVARQYPLQFMEKQSDGSCVFRNPRCEERLAKKFEDGIQRKREKTMYQVQVEIDKEEMQIKSKECKRRKRDTLSTHRIQSLHDGKEIFDAISNATDPSSVQDALSDEQKRLLYNYKRSFQDNKVAIMQRKYDEAWKKLCEEETLERNVVPVLKVKLVDNLSPKRSNTAGTALLTVWRPSEQIITTLGEGKRLKIYNVYASKYSKGANDIQLSANRSTIYKELPYDTKCQDVFQARKVYTFGELSKGLKPGVEVDIVAVVISHSSHSNLTLVYMADPDLNFVRLRIWGGLEDQALQDIMKEKGFIAASNLLCQPDRRSGIPSLKYYELSMATSNPSNQMLRHNLRELRKAVLDPASFVAQAKAKLNELCGEASKWTTPKGSSGSALRITPSYSEDGKRATETPLQSNKEVMFGKAKQGWSAPSNSITPNSSTSMTCCKTAGNLQQSRKRLLQLKRRKLDLIPNPPPLSPLPNTLPDSVRKEFKVPRRIITQSKENDTM